MAEGPHNFRKAYKYLEGAGDFVRAEIAAYGQVQDAPTEYHEINRIIEDVQQRVADVGWPESEETEAEDGEVSAGE